MSPALPVHTRRQPAGTRSAEQARRKQRPLVRGSLVAIAPASVNWESVRRTARTR